MMPSFMVDQEVDQGKGSSALFVTRRPGQWDGRCLAVFACLPACTPGADSRDGSQCLLYKSYWLTNGEVEGPMCLHALGVGRGKRIRLVGTAGSSRQVGGANQIIVE